MPTKRKTYVAFRETTYDGEPVVEVRTLKGDLIGVISWYARYRQHDFEMELGMACTYDCLEDIAAKMKAMDEARRQVTPSSNREGGIR